MRERPRTSAQAWFRRYQAAPAEPRLRLVCFPHAGGTPALFRTWARYLGSDIDLLAVCYPGRHDRFAEPCIDRMGSLADLVTEALLPLCDRPVALFGHSMGALVGYEVAVRMQQRWHPPDRLLVSAHMPPNRMPTGRYPDDDEALLAQVHGSGATSPELPRLLDNAALRRLVLPAMRADHRLLNTYRCAAATTVETPIVGYLGRDDPLVAPADVADWATMTAEGFELHTFPGDHFYLTGVEPELVADVRRRLDPVVRAGAERRQP